ncbi:MAG: lipopolysaccharide transport periplasmic protein LptA [Rhodoferax sp.]|uniref:lipopolysaccharide transport periplasmic protein LptA n=1 Tax=Rhodoferax sp. TaxID=50421 RepID=UPI0026121EBA|nr:lipopolysaccharide transport periplasmic protein LptA [Rhodoferax sp.]MDD2881160.1 lipopolysaccharide transport periplasmic protein LptA [Rhodoferax sp.]
MKTPFLPWLLLGVLTLAAPWVLAEKADRDKPMNVEADALRYDDLKQLSVFTGRVVLTKGSILIRGGKVEVRQDPQGNQFGLVTAEPGKLAFFRQKREGVDEYIEGEGERIEYDGQADTVKFITRAQLRRYQGAKLNDEFNAGVIVYNNTTEVFTLDGAPGAGSMGSAGQPGAPAGRVRAMLTPKPQPSASAPVSGQPLRATPELGGASR